MLRFAGGIGRIVVKVVSLTGKALNQDLMRTGLPVAFSHAGSKQGRSARKKAWLSYRRYFWQPSRSITSVAHIFCVATHSKVRRQGTSTNGYVGIIKPGYLRWQRS